MPPVYYTAGISLGSHHHVSIERTWNSFELVRFKKTLTRSRSNNGFNEMPKWGYGSCEEKYKAGAKAAGYL